MRSRLEWEHLALTAIITLLVFATGVTCQWFANIAHDEHWWALVELAAWVATFWFYSKTISCLKALREQWQEGKA